MLNRRDSAMMKLRPTHQDEQGRSAHSEYTVTAVREHWSCCEKGTSGLSVKPSSSQQGYTWLSTLTGSTSETPASESKATRSLSLDALLLASNPNGICGDVASSV